MGTPLQLGLLRLHHLLRVGLRGCRALGDLLLAHLQAVDMEVHATPILSLIHISEPTRLALI
eukprot:725286-Alexandrium_andersonii.AAC.1